jgi:hypothetical protein
LELRYLWLQDRVRLKQVKLEKVDTNDMVADFLTKYSEEQVIRKHCKSLNLRFVVRGAILTTGLRVAQGVDTDSATTLTTARRTDEDESFIFFAVVLAVPFIAGVLLTLFCQYIFRRCASGAQDAVPAPGVPYKAFDEVPRVEHEKVTAPVRRHTATGGSATNALDYGSDSAVHKVLMGLLQVQLKEMCGGHRLKVGGNKTVLINRLIAADVAPHEHQCRELLRLETCLIALGHRRPAICLTDVVTRRATAETLKRLGLLCNSRSGNLG